jgi:D-alanyl-D-alanine carboxypeptidase/D-alanyl-D-alanine-endopeptidase (penicillin-binding protein 4)
MVFRRGIILSLILCSIILISPPRSAIAAAAPLAVAEQPATTDIASRLEPLLADPRLVDAQVAVVVRDASAGTVLYERNGRARLIPASNQKLLIAAAAFTALGPGYRFRTSLLTSGRQRGQVLEGNLYLKGTGDPTMLPQRWSDMAAALANLGITRISGRLIVDDTWFDDVRLGPDWSWDDESFAFASQISALTVSPDEDFDAGSILIDLQPGSGPGAPARVVLTPPTRYVRIVNQVITETPGAELRLNIFRGHGANTIVLTGTMPADVPAVRRRISIWEPTGYSADVFRTSLEQRGIRIDNPTAFGSVPLGARELASLESMPLSELAIPFLKLSNNTIAEILVKTMGRQVYGEGSWRSGMQVVADYLATIGIDPTSLRLRDGSGLSRLNLISARDLAALLVAVRRETWFTTFYDALPIAGVEERLIGGTLRFRMRGTPAERNVRAKTGTLTGVTALSGYCTGEGGQLLVFSILINNFVGSTPRDVEDAIVAAIVGPPTPPR